ncbi:Gfo/Idh/MocA family oxidoreductase [Halomonas sp. H33-56]|uniref:Gfo/Idh/MocA family oxidoreductase n=1 Tax=Halomonas sp. RT37 TaxID=2950872 RepID=A0AAU7KKA4_9GAMM
MIDAPVRWGILSTANIARIKLIPAMRASAHAEVLAVGSRNQESAQAFADEMDIPRAYASYEAVIDDPEVEAVYIPLPNHLHIELAQKALDKGKHVLCEKPLALTAEQAASLRVPPGLLFCEAFMVRHQPRWLAVKERIKAGAYGDIRMVQAMLTFGLDDPGNYRMRPEFGGGALYDVGCYAAMATRFAFGCEPRRVMAHASRDPEHGVDVVASVLLDYGEGRHASLMVSTATSAAQHLHIVGSQGAIDLPEPFIAPVERPTRVVHDNVFDLYQSDPKTETFPPMDQYEQEVSRFCRALRGEEVGLYGLEDSIANLRVIDAIFASVDSGGWAAVAQ